MKPQQLPVYEANPLSHQLLCHDVSQLTVTVPAGFSWQAGDYVWLGWDDDHLKPFSIVSAPGSDTLNVHIAHTEAIMPWLNQIKTQPIVYLRGPVAQYHWPQGDGDILFIAGGTGITPFLPMLSQLPQRAEQRKITLYWGVRRPDLLYMASWLNRLAADDARFGWHAVVSETSATWSGLKGLLPDVVAQEISTLPASTQLLCCGPMPMQQAIRQWALALGLVAANIQG